MSQKRLDGGDLIIKKSLMVDDIDIENIKLMIDEYKRSLWQLRKDLSADKRDSFTHYCKTFTKNNYLKVPVNSFCSLNTIFGDFSFSLIQTAKSYLVHSSSLHATWNNGTWVVHHCLPDLSHNPINQNRPQSSVTVSVSQ